MLELNSEEAIWCIEGTVVEEEGSAVGLIWDVIAEVEADFTSPFWDVIEFVRNCPVIDGGADVNVERVFVDGVSDET